MDWLLTAPCGTKPTLPLSPRNRPEEKEINGKEVTARLKVGGENKLREI